MRHDVLYKLREVLRVQLALELLEQAYPFLLQRDHVIRAEVGVHVPQRGHIQQNLAVRSREALDHEEHLGVLQLPQTLVREVLHERE